MTFEPKPDRPTESGRFPVLLAGLATFFTAGAFIGHIDSIEELQFQRASPWLLIGPLWGSVVYFCTRSATEGRRNGRMIARGVAVVAWAGVAIPISWWQYTQGLFEDPTAEPPAAEMLSRAVPKQAKPPVLGGDYGVQGWVVDPTGKPIAGAQLFLSIHQHNKFVATDERGRFDFSGIPDAGTCSLRAYRDDYHPWGGSIHTGGGLTIVLEPKAAISAAAPK